MEGFARMNANWQSITIVILALLGIGQLLRAFQVRRESRNRDELFKVMTENAVDMIALVDMQGNRLYNSPAYKRILGYSAAELGETSGFGQIHPDDRFRVLEAAREARRTGIGSRLEYRILHKDGTWRILESVAGTIRDKNGEVAKLVIVNRDITDRKQAEQLAEHNSLHDNLTGLPNRRFCLNRLQQSFEHSRRHPDRQHALLLIDLDGFKAVNDAVGSAAADKLLIETAGRIGGCLRDEEAISGSEGNSPMDTTVLSRMGGDEFTVLLEGIADSSDAMRLARRILATLTKPLHIDMHEVRTTASIGIALSSTTHAKAENLLQEAEVALRRAKALGGSRCDVFDESMHKLAVNRLNLESELQQALRENQFRVYYHPIVELKTRSILGFEALLHWQHPEHGLISPNKFLAAAEDTGLMVAAGQWLMLEACKQLSAWNDARRAGEPVTMSFNLSHKQLSHPRLLSDMEAILRETRAQASRLQVEITETVVASDPKSSFAVLSQLKHLGVGVTLDDFGAGDSSLNRLRLLPVRALKIDRELIHSMLADRNVYETVDLIIVIARKLKLQSIAEGIETLRQWEVLRDLGCEMGQGYLFSAPVTQDVAGGFLQDWNPTAQAKAANAP
jgi:diguanylate cyclase (GGDEF)-like protein/PAS domain S-box-containing protein